VTTARPGTVASLVAGIATVLLAVATLVLAILNVSSPAAWLAGNQANQWLGGVAFGITGALVLRAQPRNLLGPLLATAGVVTLVSTVGFQVADLAPLGSTTRAVAAWCGSVLWLPPFLGLLMSLPVLFPDGRLPSARWRWPMRCGITAWAVAVLSLATTQYALDDGGYRDVRNPLDLPTSDGAQLAVTLVCLVVCVVLGLAGLVSVGLRLRTSSPTQRAQHAWFTVSVLLQAGAAFLPLPDWASFVVEAASLAALAVGIVHFNLFDIEVVLPRAVTYVALTLASLVAYVGAVAALGSGADGGFLPAIVTAVVALALAGGRVRLQRLVERLLYGDRDPGHALTVLGDRLGSAVAPDEVLPVAVETVRASFHLPFAEVRLAGESDPAYSSGDRPERTTSFPLAHAGEDVGTLEVGLRRGERTLSETDAAVLAAFASQAAVAAYGVRAARELRRSRDRIVLAREEERSRLRRDLHDGLGPALAGISLGLETASRSAADNPRAVALLRELREDTAACVDDIRRIVADLRPPALDGAGLVSALKSHAENLTHRSGGRLDVRVVDGNQLPRLPAAVEVAAYRIATEAMTNTARHSHATSCTITCALDETTGALHVEVVDDGNGASPSRAGTGLTSMRERAEELGGRCLVVFRAGAGTRVVADLPYAATGAR
jgi:two-component system NarL family sensor kinase